MVLPAKQYPVQLNMEERRDLKGLAWRCATWEGGLVDLLGCFLEGGLRRPPFLRHRVPPLGHNHPVGRRLGPRLGQADGGVPAQTDVPAPAVDHDALDLGPAPGGIYVKIEPGPRHRTCPVRRQL